MSDIPTIGIGELAPVRGFADALNAWNGFVQLVPALLGGVAMPYLILRDSAAETWKWDQMPQYSLGPVGCSFLRDLEVSGTGYLFHQGRFVREFVNLSDTALRWLGQPDVDDNPLIRPRTSRLVIDEPVLMVFGPGCGTYGHWLLDFMPRIFIARQLLGPAFDDFVLPLPSDLPQWVSRMLQTFCGVDPGRFRYFSRHEDLLVCRRACLPSYAHSGTYSPHPLMRAFYEQFGNPGAPRSKRRICISRRNQEAFAGDNGRIFEARETLERMAVACGFEIVQPETLSFPEQVELFRSASCILGEHGSGMHGAVFADPGTIVAVVRAPQRNHQLKIAAAFEHKFICMNRIQVTKGTLSAPLRFTATEDDLGTLLAMIDKVQNCSV
jgi:Glycosyltransferase 61